MVKFNSLLRCNKQTDVSTLKVLTHQARFFRAINSHVSDIFRTYIQSIQPCTPTTTFLWANLRHIFFRLWVDSCEFSPATRMLLVFMHQSGWSLLVASLRHVHIRITTFNMVDRLINFVSQNPALFNKREKNTSATSTKTTYGRKLQISCRTKIVDYIFILNIYPTDGQQWLLLLLALAKLFPVPRLFFKEPA